MTQEVNSTPGIKNVLGFPWYNQQPINLPILQKIFNELDPYHLLEVDTVMLWATFILPLFCYAPGHIYPDPFLLFEVK